MTSQPSAAVTVGLIAATRFPRKSFFERHSLSLYGDGDNGGERSNGRRIVLLHPHQSAQDVVSVPRPGVDVSVLQPGGDVALS